jgi:WD40 repeat protein
LTVAHSDDHSCKYKTVLLSTDYSGGGINAIDPVTGVYKYTQFYPSLLPVSDKPLIALNGLKILNNYLYYTSKGSYFRLPISLDDLFTSLTISATGPVETIAILGDTDDLFVLKDGTAFVADNRQNQIVKVTLDGNMTTVAGGLNETIVAGPTSCVLGRTAKDHNILYVSTCGGQLAPVNGTFTEPGKVVAVPL